MHHQDFVPERVHACHGTHNRGIFVSGRVRGVPPYDVGAQQFFMFFLILFGRYTKNTNSNMSVQPFLQLFTPFLLHVLLDLQPRARSQLCARRVKGMGAGGVGEGHASKGKCLKGKAGQKGKMEAKGKKGCVLKGGKNLYKGRGALKGGIGKGKGEKGKPHQDAVEVASSPGPCASPTSVPTSPAASPPVSSPEPKTPSVVANAEQKTPDTNNSAHPHMPGTTTNAEQKTAPSNNSAEPATTPPAAEQSPPGANNSSQGGGPSPCDCLSKGHGKGEHGADRARAHQERQSAH